MSTTSPVISVDAEASRFSLPCSAARASGENAKAEMNPAATAAFKLLGIVELNMPETSTRKSRRSIMLHPPPSFSCHVERTRLPRSSFMQRRETALILLPINFRPHELVCRLGGGLGRASPYQQRPRSRIGRRDSVEPEEAPI